MTNLTTGFNKNDYEKDIYSNSGCCSNKDNINSNSQAENVSRFPLLKVDNLQTKTILDGTQVKFVVDDVISVFNGVVSADNHHGHCLYQCISVENGVATFQWMDGIREDRNELWNKYEPADDVDIIATYPNRSESTSAFEPVGEGYGAGTVMIRMVASGAASDENTFAGTSMPIIASAPQGQMLKFKHTCGLLKVTLKGSSAINKVVMKGNTDITGDASVAYASDEPVLKIVGADTKSKTITYTYNEPVQLTAEGRDLYFGLPVGTHDVTFTFTDTDGNTMVKTAKNLEIERAVVTPTELAYQPVVEDITDLSANGSYANCYVIQEPGRYSFDAKKPDGEAVTGVKAAWIWASGDAVKGKTALPETLMKQISYASGKVYFTIPEGYSNYNAVLGVIDADDNLVYTWHIWITASGMQDITVGDVVVMDRNLGAENICDVTSSDATTALMQGVKGLYYSWGRKDPILGGRNAAPAGGETTAFAAGNSQYCVINTALGIASVSAWGINGGFTTADAAAQNPLTMSKSGVYGTDSASDWCNRTNANPCPYGYRVINKIELQSLYNTSVIDAHNANFGQVKLAGAVILPKAGMRASSTGKSRRAGVTSKDAKSNPYGLYFCNDYAKVNNNVVEGSVCQFVWTYDYVDTKLYTYSTTTMTSLDISNAASVRCVKVSE